MADENQGDDGRTVDDRLSRLEEIVEDLRSENESLQEEKQRLESEVTELQSRVGEVETELRNNRDNIESNRDSIESNRDDIESDSDSETETELVATDGGVRTAPIEWRGDGKHMENLWIDDVPVGKAVENVRGRVDDVQSEVEEIHDGGVAEEDSTQNSLDEDASPIERLDRNEDLAESASDVRALSIYRHIDEWSRKTPNGRIIRTGQENLKNLLDASLPDDDVSSWKQVYRACEALEDLSDGHVDFREVNGSKALVIDDDSPALTASSVGK